MILVVGKVLYDILFKFRTEINLTVAVTIWNSLQKRNFQSPLLLGAFAKLRRGTMLRGRVGCLRQPTIPLSIRINTGSLYRNVSILNYKRDKDNVS